MYEPQSREDVSRVYREYHKEVWVGISDYRYEGRWCYDSSGRTVPFLPGGFAHGQPDGGKSENCAVVVAGSHGGKGRDANEAAEDRTRKGGRPGGSYPPYKKHGGNLADEDCKEKRLTLDFSI